MTTQPTNKSKYILVPETSKVNEKPLGEQPQDVSLSSNEQKQVNNEQSTINLKEYEAKLSELKQRELALIEAEKDYNARNTDYNLKNAELAKAQQKLDEDTAYFHRQKAEHEELEKSKIRKSKEQEQKRIEANKVFILRLDDFADKLYNTHPQLTLGEVRDVLTSKFTLIAEHLGLPLKFNTIGEYVTLATQANFGDSPKTVESFTSKSPVISINGQFPDNVFEARRLCRGLSKFGLSAQWLNQAFRYIDFYTVGKKNEEVALHKIEITTQFKAINNRILRVANNMQDNAKQSQEDIYIINYLCDTSKQLEKLLGIS